MEPDQLCGQVDTNPLLNHGERSPNTSWKSVGECSSGLKIFINLALIIKYIWYIDYGMPTFNNYQYSNEKIPILAAF
jgi:hypothetical protein